MSNEGVIDAAGRGEEVLQDELQGCEEPEREAGEMKPTMRRSPSEPTQAEISRHRVNHTPYRSWCPECVKARAKMPPHRQIKTDGEKAVPTIHIDYWFMRDRRGAELIGVATFKDDLTKTFKAHVVNGKGNVEGVAEQIVKDLQGIGYNDKVILKCDQEAALVDLAKAIARIRKEVETVIEHSKAKDSQTNGVAERAVQSVEGLVRTMKFALEKRLGVQICSSHPLMAWIVEHAAETLNRFHVGQDGRTPFERVKGKAYKGEVVEFGRVIYHRHPGKVEGGSMEPRWSEGVWLGKNARSDEHMISDETGRIVKAGGIALKPENESWDGERIMAVKVHPNGLNEPKVIRRSSLDPQAQAAATPANPVEPVREPDERDGPEIADPVQHQRGPADIYIRYEDLKRSGGFTPNCAKCKAMKMGDRSKSRASHSAECRTRVRAWMAQDSVHKTKIEEADRRKDEYLAKRVEEHEMEHSNAKQPRIAVDGDPMVGLTPGASSSGQKRVREDDPEDEMRPTHYRTLAQDEELLAAEEGPPAEHGEQVAAPMAAPERVQAADPTVDMESDGDASINLEWQEPSQLLSLKETVMSLYPLEQRGGSKLSKYVVAEAFSPPRICKRARERGLAGGWSLDWLTMCPVTGRKWDLRDNNVQKKVVDMIRKDKPELLILCPPCTFFSALQNLAGDPRIRCPDKWKEAVGMVNFAVELSMLQKKSGRKFLFEHPLGATSWTRTKLKELSKESSVVEAKTHMCVFGMEATDSSGTAPVMKPTRFLTNSMAIQEMLQKSCSRDHRHVHLVNGRCSCCGIPHSAR